MQGGCGAASGEADAMCARAAWSVQPCTQTAGQGTVVHAGWVACSRVWGGDSPCDRGWGRALVAAALPALGTACVDAEVAAVGGRMGRARP